MNLEAIQANSGRLWQGYAGSWTTIRDSVVANSVVTTELAGPWNYAICAYVYSYHQVSRVMLTFPTDTLTGTLLSATLHLASNPQTFPEVPRGVSCFASTHHNPVEVGDFDITRLGALSGALSEWVSLSGTWNAISLDIAHVNIGAVTKLALLDTFHDVGNEPPIFGYDSCQGIFPPGHATLAPYLKLTFESEPEEPKRGNNYCLGLRIKDKVFNWVSKTQSKFGDF